MNNTALRLRSVLANLCRLVLAATFIFSGFVKIIDPKGMQYKLEDYAVALGIEGIFDYLPPLVPAVLLGVVEFLLGVYLFFGIRRRVSSWFILLYMLVMTPFTLYIALANPVSDCGCFGDAFTLTNWQTFGKNVALLAMAVVVCLYKRLFIRFVSERNQWMVSFFSLLYACVLSFICIYGLPIIDFRPYHVGTNLLEAMQVPEGQEEPVYETYFILERDGVQQEFTAEEYPDDTTWQYVDTRTVLLRQGYVPPIHDFSILTPDGQDLTQEVLAGPGTGYTFLLVAPHLEDTDDSNVDRINALNDYCQRYGHGFCCLTASGTETMNQWTEFEGADYPIYNTDETALKTMVRSNPGLLLLHHATVVGKWGANNLPREADYDVPQGIEALVSQPRDKALTALYAILWYVLPLMLCVLADRIWVGSKLRQRMRHKKRLSNLLKNKRMRKKIVAGNWKMNLNLQEGVALATELNAALAADKPNCDVVICTPFIHLASVAGVIDAEVIGLGAENCADKEKGAYTGEVSAAMVKSTGAQYVILGHSERRAYYGETAEILKEKVNLALANGLKVIFCIGEVLEEREAGKQNEVVGAQLAGSLFDLTAEQFANIILAYEPVWAIGTGKTATAEQAEEMHAFIRQTIAGKFGAEAAENVSILYGGSCKPSNAKEIFAKPDVDGGLIGGAALKCADFKGIIDAWKA